MSFLTNYWNKIGGLVGLGGGQGEYYQADPFKSAGQDALKENLNAQNSGNVKNLIADMQAGKISLAEAMGKTNNAAEQSALASSPIGATLVASEQVRSDPLTSGFFGEGGSQDRALSEEQNLASRGYSLQPEDFEAYGQASGNIARQFGQQEQSLGEALAARGMSAGGSGNAMAQFTGLQGNKNEQLGQMQRQIADNRMKSNLDRLNSTRSYLSQLGGLGQQALGGNRTANMQGAQLRNDTANALAGQELGGYQAQQAANQASMTSKLANKESSLSDAIGKGIYSGVQGGVSSGIGYGSGQVTGMNDYNTKLAAAGKTGIGGK